MSSKARGGLSKREWKAANPGQPLPGSSSSSSSSSSSNDISEYREDLLKLLKPTDEENEVSTQISNVESSRDTGIQAIKEKPIEMDPILGQSRNVETRAALELGTLEDRLARLTSSRQADASVLSAALGFAVDDRAYETEQDRYADSMTFQDKQFNEGVRQYDQNYSLNASKEARIAGGSGKGSSNDFDPRDSAQVQSYVYEAVAGGESWPDIVNTMGALGASVDEVDKVLQQIFGYYKKD